VEFNRYGGRGDGGEQDKRQRHGHSLLMLILFTKNVPRSTLGPTRGIARSTLGAWFTRDPPLRSAGSMRGHPRLFVRVVTTMKKSDFSHLYLIGDGCSRSRYEPSEQTGGRAGDLRVPEQNAYRHAGVFDHAG
jgi:hypothetical protein